MSFEPEQEHNFLLNSDIKSFWGNKAKQVALYKTEYCRNWAELGHCRYGKKCRYAHDENELRSVPRHGRYKTQICRAYHFDGTCPYGVDSPLLNSNVWNSKLGLAIDHYSNQQRGNHPATYPASGNGSLFLTKYYTA